MCDAVRVYARIRPSPSAECCLDVADGQIAVLGRRFAFDAVLDELATQERTFEVAAAPLAERFAEGGAATVFTYGQTSSGKTFTAIGGEGERRGLLPRLAERLLRSHAALSLSFLEIYNERLRDLLSPAARVRLRQRGGAVYPENITSVAVTDVDGFRAALSGALGRRATAATALNAASSRSHFVCVIGGAGVAGRLSVVDLAGSEKVCRALVAGRALDEAKSINKSLTELGKVIFALSESGPRFIDFRSSTLTRLLQCSLSRGARTAMIVTVSPAAADARETLAALRFAARVKTAKLLSVPTLSAALSAAELRAALSARERQIAELRARLAKCERSASPRNESESPIFSLEESADFDLIRAMRAKTERCDTVRNLCANANSLAALIKRFDAAVRRVRSALADRRASDSVERFLGASRTSCALCLDRAPTATSSDARRRSPPSAPAKSAAAFDARDSFDGTVALAERLCRAEAALAAERAESRRLRADNAAFAGMIARAGRAVGDLHRSLFGRPPSNVNAE